MKKAIALFSTLLILVMVILLMSIALKNSTKIKVASLQDRYLIQENLTISDIKKFLNKKIAAKLNALPPIKRIDILNLLFAVPLHFDDPVNKAKITIKLKPLDDKFNINFIVSDGGKEYIKKIFERIGVKDSKFLEECLLANIVTSDEGKSSYDDQLKLYLKDSSKRAGPIENKNMFNDILQLYIQNSNDIEARKIDFSKYFSFFVAPDITYNRFDKNDINLDINYVDIVLLDTLVGLSTEVKNTLQNPSLLLHSFKEMHLVVDKENHIDEQDILETHGFKFESKNIRVLVNIESINYKIKYAFNYNLEKKKISNISMDRWIY